MNHAEHGKPTTPDHSGHLHREHEHMVEQTDVPGHSHQIPSPPPEDAQDMHAAHQHGEIAPVEPALPSAQPAAPPGQPLLPGKYRGHAGLASDHSPHGEHAGPDHHARMVEDFKRRFNLCLLITVPILVLSPMVQMFLGLDLRFEGDTYLLLALATVLFIYGGLPFLAGARDELQKQSPGMMTLIALAISVAYIYSTLTMFVLVGMDFFWELATLIDIMLLGHWIEMKSVMGASRALEELVRLMPEEAHLIGPGGETNEVAVQNLHSGDAVLVKPGEKIPIDGIVFDGLSTVNEAMLTGESSPVDKVAGDQVIGGSINGEGALRFKVIRTGSETFLSQIIILVSEAQKSQSNTQRLADVAAKWLFYVALLTGILTFTAWMVWRGDFGFALERAVTVMVISCPHALGLAVPLVTAVSTSIAARRGLLIRNRARFENARNVDAVIFDKTGTLTQGEFGITDIQAYGISEEELLSLAYALEANSTHPISLGIVKEARQRNIPLRAVADYHNVPGRGLQATLGGRAITVMSPGFMREQKIGFDEAVYAALAQQGKTVVFVAEGNSLLGFIALSDLLRDSARQAIDTLRAMKVESYMLTGDNQRAANYVAAQLDMDKVYAEVLPEGKSLQVQAIQKSGKTVAMTGDGVNDAPALAQADLGIAIGAGTDVAIETADVILVKSDPLDVVSLLQLSRATYGKMVQNLMWATGYNVIAIPLAAGIFYDRGIVISPAAGAILMSMSTIIVAMNARSLKID